MSSEVPPMKLIYKDNTNILLPEVEFPTCFVLIYNKNTMKIQLKENTKSGSNHQMCIYQRCKKDGV